MDSILSFSQLAATNINTQMTPQEHAEVEALNDRIQELLRAGTMLSLWYNADHPARLQWAEAAAKAVSQIAPPGTVTSGPYIENIVRNDS